MAHASLCQQRGACPWPRGTALSLLAAVLVCPPPSPAATQSGVSPQTLSLPSGPGSIEGLGESFEPQLNTGTAVYSVPLALPPGRAGHAPGLALSYNGGSGNGLLGVGWSLSGLAHIQRQSDKGLPRYDATDVFVTSSGEELVPLSDGTWREENEGAFRRYRFDAATNSWQCDTPEGGRLTFGADPSARSENAGRTFSWHLTRSEDRNGNLIEYEYTGFADSPGRVYPRRIAYTRHVSQSLAGEQRIVFSYETAVRPDVYSDHRAGFEVTMSRRLSRIDVCTLGGSAAPGATCADVGEPGAARAASYRLRYDDQGACQANACQSGLVAASCSTDADCVTGVTRLESVELLGADDVTSLPRTSFEYTDLDLSRAPPWHGVPGFPFGAYGGPDTALVDLDADGLPDVLETGQAGSYRRWLNRGPLASGSVAFAAPEGFVAPMGRLSVPGTQIADLDGDAISDLLIRPNASTPQFRIYRGDGRGRFALAWEPFEIQGYDSFSGAGFESPEVRLGDLDGDKRIDVLRTLVDTFGTATSLWLRLNRGSGLAPTVACAPVPNADFAGSKTFLSDLNGDRLLDIVVVETASDRVTAIRYYPSMGSGAFGRGGSCSAQGPPIVLGGDAVWNLPGADFQGFSGFRWQDITSDGLSDLIHLGGGRVTAWINVGGGRLRRFDLATYPQGIDFDPNTGDRIEIADVDGNGTADLLLVDRESASVHYLDLVGPNGVPPNLLRSIDNGLGRRTLIEYEPSTRGQLAALQSGTAWRSRPPFPVTVVSRRRVVTGLDFDGVPGPDEVVTDFRYRDGYYDAREREFRGFSEVEVIERGDAGQPTLVTRHSFHTGAPDGVDNDGDGQIDEYTESGGAEEEILKGVVLEVRTEACVDGPDGPCATPGERFRHDYQRWNVRRLYSTGVCSGDPGRACCGDDECSAAGAGSCVVASPSPLLGERSCAAGKEVRFAAVTAKRSAILERGQPGDRADLMRESDYDAYGNPRIRRSWGVVTAPDLPAFGCLLSSGLCSDDGVTLCGRDADCAAGSCLRSSATDAVTCSGDPFSFSNPAQPDDERVTEMTHSSDHASGLSRWLLRSVVEEKITDENGARAAHARYYYDGQDTLGVLTRGNLTKTESWLRGSEWLASLRSDYDVYGNVIASYDPLYGQAPGHATAIVYDDAMQTWPEREILYTGNPGLPELEFSAHYDHRFGVVDSSTDLSGHVTRYGYDGLGRLTSIQKPLDPGHSVEFDYALGRDGGGGEIVSWIETRHRDGSSGDGMLRSRAFYDGLGRLLLTRAEGESPGQVVVSDAVRFNARQSTSRRFHPYLDSGDLDWAEPSLERPFSAHLYDALGRETRVEQPATGAESVFSTTQYTPLATTLRDEEQTNPTSPHYGASKRYVYDGLEEENGPGRLLAVQEVVKISDVGESLPGPAQWRTTYQWSLLDDVTVSVDSQGNRRTVAYDGLRRKTSLDDPDRGTVSYDYDAASNLIETVDAKGQRIVYGYDGLNRIISKDHLDEGLPFSANRSPDVVYDYDVPPGPVDLGDGSSGLPSNTKGLRVRVGDATGEEWRSYDERGRLAWLVKRIVDPGTGLPVAYRTGYDYDSMDRISSIRYPDGDRIDYAYDARGLLDSVGVSGGAAILKNVGYNEAGQIEVIDYGNGVSSSRGYDARLRLTRLASYPAASPGAPTLSYGYIYDGAGNITRVDDLRPISVAAAGDSRRDSQRFEYDDLYRLTGVAYSAGPPGGPATAEGAIAYRYDRIGNMLSKMSDIAHSANGYSLTDVGQMRYGGAAGSSGRAGRTAGDPPGPHALTATDNGGEQHALEYDDNGNRTRLDGTSYVWDFEDRLVSVDGGSWRSEHRYDYADRRVVKRVSTGSPDPEADCGDRVSTTIYAGRDFEVRDGQPIKYVHAGEGRVARVTGTLDPGAARVQRLLLRTGWNLVAVALAAGPALAGRSAIDAVWRWDAAEQSWLRSDASLPLEQGMILWLHAGEPLALPLVGSHEGGRPFTAGTGYRAGPGLAEATLTGLTDGGDAVWGWDAVAQRWCGRFGGALAALSGPPPPIAAGRVVFVAAAEGAAPALADPSGGILYLHKDHLGSSSLTTTASGSVLAEEHYYPFGGTRILSGNADPRTSYRFSGKERDDETGSYYFGARHYDPLLGRFLSVDPVLREAAIPNDWRLDPQRLDLYSYVENRPLVRRDPLGFSSQSFGSWFRNVAAQELTTTVQTGDPEAILSALQLSVKYGELEQMGTFQAIEAGKGARSVEIRDTGSYSELEELQSEAIKTVLDPKNFLSTRLEGLDAMQRMPAGDAVSTDPELAARANKTLEQAANVHNTIGRILSRRLQSVATDYAAKEAAILRGTGETAAAQQVDIGAIDTAIKNMTHTIDSVSVGSIY